MESVNSQLRKMKAAEAYVARGWKVFTVSPAKRPFGNCKACQPQVSGIGHSPEACTCLQCHGFYAATANLDRIRAMLWSCDGAMLAIRTGCPSSVVAIDAEGHDGDGHGYTGLEVLDQFESYTGGVSLQDSLKQRTGGGGLHILYKLPDQTVIGSRNRVLPNVDIKADGGYVVVGPTGGRSWLNWGLWSARLETPGDDLLRWLQEAKGKSKGSGSGGSSLALSLRTAAVIPAGVRYEFTRDLVYHLRRNCLVSGHTYESALEVCRAYWLRYEQPGNGMRKDGNLWLLPFSQVEYELTRVWARVQPEEPVSMVRMAWARKQAVHESAQK